jgi:hypothetical protein
VVYPWHPAFSANIKAHFTKHHRGERVYVCLMPNDSGVVIPAWMFDVGACAPMKLGRLRVSMAVLEDLCVIFSDRMMVDRSTPWCELVHGE